jgi:DNA polymerase-3 subunit alpha
MAFVKISDELQEMEVILFPSIYQQTTGIWDQDKVVVVKGKLSAQDKDGKKTDDIKVMADEAREITFEQASAYQGTGKKKAKVPKPAKAKVKFVPATEEIPPRVYVRIEDSSDEDLLASLKRIIDAHSGEDEVVLVVGNDKNKQIIRVPSRFERSDSSLQDLHKLVGEANVKIQ